MQVYAPPAAPHARDRLRQRSAAPAHQGEGGCLRLFITPHGTLARATHLPARARPTDRTCTSITKLTLPPCHCGTNAHQVLDGPTEELRRDALDAICTCGVLLGPDFALFVPVAKKVGGPVGGWCQSISTALGLERLGEPGNGWAEWVGRLTIPYHTIPGRMTTTAAAFRYLQIAARHRLVHDWFERLAAAASGAQPPCMSDAEDWEATRWGMGSMRWGDSSSHEYSGCGQGPHWPAANEPRMAMLCI